ncbi:ABC transporter permease [Nocardioides marmoribigeumensis]|jgi:simple sugar transport system permease protein|uniref:Simple sugar transport system permease protein n=1 Tax=Nocardioides marmoribigeumensis TaxID=433649 RepID=A0ABU2BZW3_9ACTN|nr:ABC transporter permease [Nocardioides marmoribigeumensis]MDR7363951.1 simple sugar transport system permease protein [Nocardioides marmoribigeumensis]
MDLPKRLVLALAAPVLAFVVSGIVATVVLMISGDDVASFWSTLTSWPEKRNLVNIVNYAGILYLSGVAAAIGFRMNLFNIGVEGQYRIAGLAAGWVAGAAWLPGYANTALAIVAAMVVGALWAGIAGWLRVSRGVSEVISTIMLNAIAGAMIGYLINKVGVRTGVDLHTENIPQESWVGTIPLLGADGGVYGLTALAVLVGVVYWLLLSRTRFGFELRATGMSETAAVASGVNVKRMIVYTMLMSGAVAGLISLPAMFGSVHNYGQSTQAGLGFAGIAVALLGRNNPAGIAAGALVFAFLREKGNLLNILAGISPEIVAVTQGVIVLAVVIAYELVRRYRVRSEQAAVAEKVDVHTEVEGARA